MSRHRNWCVTINNYDEKDFERIESLIEDLLVKYYIYGREVGSKGTPHIQGYVEFSNAIGLKGIVKRLGKHGHYEPRRGTQEQAIIYCKKENAFTEGGEPSSDNGVRKDWLKINNNIKLGSTVRAQIDEGYNNLQCIQHIEKISKYLEPSRNAMPRVYWVYGESGSGKSLWASTTFPDAYWCDTFQWWDGYDGHSAVIIDDYRSDFCKFNELLRLLDRYPYKVPIKGGYRQFVAKDIVITTPRSAEDTWFAATTEDLTQLKRRIYKEVELTQATLGNTDTNVEYEDETISDLDEYRLMG